MGIIFLGILSNHFAIVYVLYYLNILSPSFFENAHTEMYTAMHIFNINGTLLT